MPRWFNILVQGVGTMGQLLNVVGVLVPPKYQLLATTIMGAIQAAIAVVSHNYNPDGTPVALPYAGK